MDIGIIAGTGALELFESSGGPAQTTPFGAPSARPERVRVGDRNVWFLARHGRPHRIPPHRVNYRANVHALGVLGVKRILAVNAVGGIDPALDAGALVVPDQLIDYTWGRAHTFSDGGSAPLKHVEFGEPFTQEIRQALIAGAADAGVPVVDGGCYAATQGPRLETAAEIRKLASDGCSMVGMTGMPEAALAREMGIEYAAICVVSNPAAGVGAAAISVDEIHQVLAQAMRWVVSVIQCTVTRLDGNSAG